VDGPAQILTEHASAREPLTAIHFDALPSLRERDIGACCAFIARYTHKRSALADTFQSATQLDPYLPFIRDTLGQYPRLRATRLFEMVKGRGYAGSVVQLRRAVRLIRPAATATLYRRLTVSARQESPGARSARHAHI
jgi:hypothetical protein